jgi:hypothetical protein
MVQQLLLVALGGFAAGMVDGALGMGFGPTSSTILLSAGVSPVATSTTVNLAKVVIGVVSGGSHWSMGNVDRRLVVRLAIPGALGAILGTTVLANVDPDTIRPMLAGALVVVGVRLLFRFARTAPAVAEADSTTVGSDLLRSNALRLTAAGGGVTNGLIGAWGPVVTPFLLHRRVPPRLVVGSVNTAEVFVALVAAGSLVGQFGQDGIDLPVVLAMLGGGVAAAPLAAHAVRFVPPRLLGLSMAALLMTTQVPELLAVVGVSLDPIVLGGAVAVVASVTALGRAVAGAVGSSRSARQPGVGVIDHRPHVIGEVAPHQRVEGDRLHDGSERGA